MKRLVLVGAGHAHVEVLRRFGLRPLDGTAITLVTREALTPYTGMLPGFVAGRYRLDEIHIDAMALARGARAEVRLDEAVGLDLAGRTVTCRKGPPLPFDVLSMDIGSRPNTGPVAGAAEHAIPVKPIDGFVARFGAMLGRVKHGRSRHVMVVGGGAGGVELLLAVHERLRRDAAARDLRFSLVTASDDILPGFPPAFRARFRDELRRRDIAVHAGTRVLAVEAGRVLTADMGALEADEVLWTTEAAAAGWLSESGLRVDPGGFVRVDATLRAAGRADVFAAGDMVAFDPAPIPRSGVYAVRAGPVLAANLRATLETGALTTYRPQRHALYIVTTGSRSAVATRNGFTAGGAWARRMKEWIDRRFMRRYARRAPGQAGS